MWYVYILRCSDGSLYTGSTTDIERRLKEHKEGRGCAYTRSRLPVTLIYKKTLPDRSFAQREEARIKKMSRQKKLRLLREKPGASDLKGYA